MKNITCFNNEFIIKVRNIAIFLVIYTLMFSGFFASISYTLPFVLAFILAVWTKPLANFLMRKYNFPKGLSSIIVTSAVILISVLGTTILLIKISIEAKALLVELPNIKTLSNQVYYYIDKFQIYYNNIDPNITQKLHQQLFGAISSITDFIVIILNKILSFAVGIPIVVMIIFIMLFALYFYAADIDDIERKFYDVFTIKGKSVTKNIIKEGNKMLGGYLKVYFLLIGITFVETLIGFLILRVKYAFILSLVSAFVDVLPVFGIAAVFIPLIIYYYIKGSYIIAAGLVVLYILIVVIRQILEPKLVASSLGVGPVAILAAIFIGLQIKGFLGMIYLIFLIIFYNILKKTDVL